MKKQISVLLILSLIVLMQAVFAEKSELIVDKRFERLTWFEGNTYCVHRSFLSGAPTVLWDGSIRLVSTNTVEYKTLTWQEEVIDYDCSAVDKFSDESSCVVVGKHNESRTRTDTILSPLKSSLTADLSKLALSAKTSSLPSIESSEPVKSATKVRWCFYVPLNAEEKGAHISYVSIDGERFDVCESTDVNITVGSLAFQEPTAANNSWVNQNWTEANISITTDNLGVFKFNWNGTNASLRGINCLENMSYIDALGGYCIDQYEASVPGCDIVGSNSASYNLSDYVNTTYCIPVSGVFGLPAATTGTTVNATSRPLVAPLVGVSQLQAQQMCSNAGKHLCTSDEWLAAANLLGQVYNLPSGGVGNYTPLNNSNTTANCNTNTFCQYNNTVYTSNRVCMTGNLSSCRSAEGVYDMVGNVRELCNESITTISPVAKSQYAYINSSLGWSNLSSDDNGKYGKDGVYFAGNTSSGHAVIRGGFWSNVAGAGVFSATLGYAPSNVANDIGFRCCNAPSDFVSVSRGTYQNVSDVFLDFSLMNTSSQFPLLVWGPYTWNQYNSTEWRFYVNVTNLSQGTYSYYGWANDSGGNSGETGIRFITLGEVPEQYLNISLPFPENATVSTETFWNFTWLWQGTIASGLATLNLNGTINTTIASLNDTIENQTLELAPGNYTWSVNVSGAGLNNTVVENTSGTYWLQIDTTTTTTTTTTNEETTTTEPTTTTSNTSTTTSLPIAQGSNQGILWIYAVLLPCFALISTLTAFYFTQKQVLACLTSSIFASILWFISSLTTSNIIFIDNFTVTNSPYYTHLGNAELGYLFMGFGILMALYTILVIMNRISQSRRETNG